MEKGIVVVGAGGHAKVCIESLRAMGKQVDYCIGEASDRELCLGVPILTGDENLKRLRDEGYEIAFIAIGSNRLRKRLGELATGIGYRLTNAIHPGSVVSPTAKLGVGVAVMAGAVINAEASIGALSIVNTGATVDHDCVIGAAVHIAPQCGLAGNVNVRDFSFLGVGTRVIPNIHIGTNVTVGAGAVVISDIDDGMTVVGVPARLIK